MPDIPSDASIEAPKRPEDLVALAEACVEQEAKEKQQRTQTHLQQARKALNDALPKGAWTVLGIDPEAAQAHESGVLAKGTFDYAGEEWACEAYVGGARNRDGVRLTIHVGHGYVLREQLKAPYHDVDRAINAAAVGSLLPSLAQEKTRAAEKREAKEQEQIDAALSRAANAFRTTYSADYLRRNLEQADSYRDGIPEASPQRERLEEMISEAEKAASEQEAQAAERARRQEEVLGKVKKVADEHLAAVETYDSECRAYAEEKAGAYFFAWSTLEVRYCPALPAETLSALRSSAAYYGGESGDEYAGAYDAVRDALVQKITALPPESGVAGQGELRYQHFDQLGYNGTTTPVTIGAFIDSTQVDYEEHDPSESMVYHRTVPVGRSVVNLPPRLPNLEAVATRIRERAPKQPTPFDGRLQEAGVSDGDLDLLPHDERIAAQRGAYRFLAGESSNFDPYYDDLPW